MSEKPKETEFEVVERRTWQMVAKDANDEPHIYDLEYTRSLPESLRKEIGKLLINNAAPTKINPTRRRKPGREDELAIYLPDAQIPFHNERAVQLGHVAIRENYPDQVVVLGDMLDFETLSTFHSTQRPEWTGRMQDSLDRYHQMLAQIRADAPDADIYAHHGNHERRFQRAIIQNNAELLGIKRADAARELGVLTLEYLLRAKELDIKFIGGYPDGDLWLQDHFRSTHGTMSRSRGSTSAAYLQKDPYTNIVHGHSHRAEIQWITTPTRDGYTQRFGASPGSLTDIERTPSNSLTHTEHGEVVPRAMNWQNAALGVEHNREMAFPHLWMIHNGQLRMFGKTYELEEGEEVSIPRTEK